MADTPNRLDIDGVFFRQVSPSHSPFWHRPLPIEPQRQEAHRYNRAGTDYVQYLASAADAAWAEHLRHAGITELEDLAAVNRVLYAAWIFETDIADLSTFEKAGAIDQDLPEALVGDEQHHLERTQDLAEMLRSNGFRGLLAPSAAFGGELTIALLGPRSEHLVDHAPESEPDWQGSSRIRAMTLARGGPAYPRILEQVRHLGGAYPDPDMVTPVS